ELVLVTGGQGARAWQRRFVMVDWGEEHRRSLLEAFPDLPPPAVTVGLVNLGLASLLERDASAYMPAKAIRHLLESGRLKRIRGAPGFTHSVFVGHPARPQDPEVLEVALEGLRAVLEPAAAHA